MDKDGYIRVMALYCLLFMALIGTNHAVVVNVKTKGAKGDGVTDDGPVITSAWKEACASAPPSSLVIPPGVYLAVAIDLSGPCKGPIKVVAKGATIKAPPELAKFKKEGWITIMYVDKLTLIGGIFDGQGQATWKSKKCPDKVTNCPLPVNLKLHKVSGSVFRDVTSINSKYFHITIMASDNNRFDNVVIKAPANSVNTDGIHIAKLNGLNITNATIKTGDDCISFGDGSKNVYVLKSTCGPGHGFGVGSLGKYQNEEPVKGIYVKNCTLIGTTNGVRIKTWAAMYPGVASDIHFEDIIMNNVQNPIVIDQEYCPSNNCKKGAGPSKVQLSKLSFKKIRGTSATQVAVKFSCSPGFPCDNVEVGDINLKFKGGTATSECSNAITKVVSPNVPNICPA